MNKKNVTSINPASREMVFKFDFVHKIKNLRNCELDDTIYFPRCCFNDEPNEIT